LTTSNPVEFKLEQQLTIPEELAGLRLDAALAKLLPEHSRARLTEWVKSGAITVDGKCLKPKFKLNGGENVDICAEMEENNLYLPEDIPLNIIFEDDHILVINKPASLVVHPAAGNWDGTLLNALLHHYPDAAKLPRAGIVHRLDKDTTGLMVVAKSLLAHTFLVDELQKRNIKRHYECVVSGHMTAGGTVNAPMGRHPKNRQKMAVVNGDTSKPAVTHYRVKERFESHTLVSVQLETGRTHQIRVHMDYINHPLVGDPLYAGRRRFPKGCSEALRSTIEAFPRQALNACSLALTHPVTKETLKWDIATPKDMQALIRALNYFN